MEEINSKQATKNAKASSKRLKHAVRKGLGRRRIKEDNQALPRFTDTQPELIDELLDSPLGRVWMADGLEQNAGFATEGDVKDGVVAAMPRRKVIGRARDGHEAPSMASSVAFQAGVLQTISRFFIWFIAVVRYYSGNFFDSLLGRNTEKRRAVRLRQILESLGATFIKLGQQMSIRADVIPYTFCLELAKMLDSIKPFPVEQAIEIIEQETGKPLKEVFAIFDPSPIGSASLACVYQAVLHTGEKVAVKVRRPKIGERLAADLRALRWLLNLAELSSVVRPGLTRNVSRELCDMLFEEMDFRREARFTEIFRRRAKQPYITAPRIFHEYGTHSLMVSEFVPGIFLWEILNAIDQKDEETLAQIRARNIEPRIVAQNMAELFNWSSAESLLFHADPHPANVICRPGNTIVMIDFGSCGRFSSKIRRLYHQLHYYMHEEDVQGMVECSISMLEPLPPIDLDRFTKEVENLYWEHMYAAQDPHSEWWERASGVLWIRFAALAGRFQIPMNLDTLRLFRATFLYDTVMFRLWKDLDIDKEYQRYHRKMGKRSKKRMLIEIKKRFVKGPTNEDYQKAEELMRMGNQILARVQHVLDVPQHSFASVIGKAAYAASMLLYMLLFFGGVHFIAIVSITMYMNGTGQQIAMSEAFWWLTGQTPYQLLMLAMGTIILRKTILRFGDIDVQKG